MKVMTLMKVKQTSECEKSFSVADWMTQRQMLRASQKVASVQAGVQAAGPITISIC